MGTPGFSVPALQSMIDNYQVSAVITQPDRPKGRGKKLAFSEVKEVAVKNNITVYQPEQIKLDMEVIQIMKDIKPDFIVVVAYGQILSKEILDIPKYGCVNLHASILPAHRGAAPINWAIIDGDKNSGNTTMLMDIGLDTGDMLLKNIVEIKENMTAGQLTDELSAKGGELLIKTLEGIVDGSITPEKQNDEKTSYAKTLNKDMATINWNDSAKNIRNFIHGLNPRPVAHTKYEGLVMKIYTASVLQEECKHEPGYIKSVSKDGIKVETLEGILLIKSLQFPGSKVLNVDEFIRGKEIKTGVVLPSN